MFVVYITLGLMASFSSNVLQQSAANQECRHVHLGYNVTNKTLMGYIVAVLTVNKDEACQIRCYVEPDCVSCNFHFNKIPNNCELSSSSAEAHPNALMMKAGTVYNGFQDNCKNDECPNHSKCQTGFGPKGYRCLCPSGFEGENCEDVNECERGTHNCSINALCTNSQGSFTCTCQVMYKGNGTTCKRLSYRHLGCFRDTSDRALAVHLASSSPMTIDKCLQLTEARGWKIFGVQNQNQCFSASDGLETYNKYGPTTGCRNGRGAAWLQDVYIIE